VEPSRRIARFERYLRFSIAAVLAPPGAVLSHTLAGAVRDGAAVSAAITIKGQAGWIASAQLPDGAIAVCPHCPVIWPYVANIATIGLARASQVSGDPTYAADAWRYLRWYSSVENVSTGYVTDYKVVNGKPPVSTGKFDSTDAYAGTFLTAAWDTFVATHSLAALWTIRAGVAGALRAIASTQQPNGLTWANPDWHVAYLMDEAQTLAGLESATRVEAALGNSVLARAALRRYLAMRAGIAKLWDPSTGAFDWARHENGWQHPTDWGVLYPDGFEQVYAVAWGAVPLAQARAVMTKFTSTQPEWSNPDAFAKFSNGRQRVGYWPATAIALNGARGAATAMATSGLAQMITGAQLTGYGWPYTTSIAGEIIVALAGGPMVANLPVRMARLHTPPRWAVPVVRRLGLTRL
jgi:hypothetical protein